MAFPCVPKRYQILPDLSRRTPVVDPDDHHLFVSLGCAAENLAIAGAAAGLPGEAQFKAEGEGVVVFRYTKGTVKPSELSAAVVRRQSARIAYDGRAIAANDLALLAQAGEEHGVQLAIITERAAINRIRDLVVAGNDVQMADKAFVRELKDWMRFNPRAAMSHGDGLYSACSGNPVLPNWLGALMFDLAFTAKAENAKYVAQLDSTPGVAVFSGEKEDHESWFKVGRACQRFALQATALGLKVAFVNQPVEVAGLRADLADLAGAKGKRPDVVMRFGHGPDLPMSPRRPVNDVIDA